MFNPPPLIIKSTLLVRHIYVCRKCSVSVLGNAVTIEVDGDPTNAIKSSRPSAHGMPMLWASYGSDGFDCPAHH